METNVTSSSRDTKRGGKRGRDSIRREGLFDGHVHDGVLQKSKEGRRPSAPPKPGGKSFYSLLIRYRHLVHRARSKPVPSSAKQRLRNKATFLVQALCSVRCRALTAPPAIGHRRVYKRSGHIGVR